MDRSAPRPRPPRPDVVVAPLHDSGPTPPPRSLVTVFTVWAASFAAFTAQAGVLAVEYETVSDALAAGLTERDPTADHYDASSAAALSMLGVGGVGLLLVLAALAALMRLRRRSLGPGPR